MDLPPGQGLGTPVTRSRGVSPWHKEEKPPEGPTKEEIEASKRKARIYAIVGAIVTIILLAIGLFYIFGDSIPDMLSGGEAQVIEIDNVTQDGFTGMSNTRLYEFTLNEPRQLTIAVRAQVDIYVEVRSDGEPVERGVIHGSNTTNDAPNHELAASLEPGTHRLLLRPLRQAGGTFEFTVSTSGNPFAAPPETAEGAIPGI